MKKIFGMLICALCLFCGTQTASAQAQIKTKKVMISDFSTKTMKVVLGSNILLDEALEQEVAGRWRISPYEFCTVDEFEALKHSPDYYFLLPLKISSGKDAGIVMLNLFKGGLEEEPDYSGFSIYNSPRKSAGRSIVFLTEDLSPAIDNSVKARHFDGKMSVSDSSDELMADSEDAIISFVVAPSEPKKGSQCYKMLIDARTHEMVYFSRHRITERKWVGFQAKDLKKIAKARKKR
mgnify:CR=1 FL=1